MLSACKKVIRVVIVFFEVEVYAPQGVLIYDSENIMNWRNGLCFVNF